MNDLVKMKPSEASKSKSMKIFFIVCLDLGIKKMLNISYNFFFRNSRTGGLKTNSKS